VQKFDRDRVRNGHRADIADRSKKTRFRLPVGSERLPPLCISKTALLVLRVRETEEHPLEMALNRRQIGRIAHSLAATLILLAPNLAAGRDSILTINGQNLYVEIYRRPGRNIRAGGALRSRGARAEPTYDKEGFCRDGR
jgi:hypothetical protein